MNPKKYFEKYVSNTPSAGGNQSHFLSDGKKVLIGRAFYRVFAEGTFSYSFLFSNVIDSTFADGSFSRKNFVCEAFRIERLRLAVVDTCDPDGLDESAFADAAFGEKASYTSSAEAEMFYTDPLRLTAKSGQYFCLEISFSGEKIPCHPESLLPLFRKAENGEWEPSAELPLPSMIGCERQVDARVGFIGDSITQGIGTAKNSYRNYAALLAEKLGDRYSFWNVGLGYARASDAASDGIWLEKMKNVDLALVCLGVNDMGRIKSGKELGGFLEKIVDSLKSAGVQIILQTIPPFNYDPERTAYWLEANESIKTVLSAKVETVFDVVPILSADPENEPQKSKYGAHPDERGNAAWAEALLPVLQSRLEAMRK